MCPTALGTALNSLTIGLAAYVWGKMWWNQSKKFRALEDKVFNIEYERMKEGIKIYSHETERKSDH